MGFYYRGKHHKGNIKINGTPDDMVKIYEENKIPYVRVSTTKPNGNKVEFVIRVDTPSARKIAMNKAFKKFYE